MYADHLPPSHGPGRRAMAVRRACFACPGWPTRHVSPLTARRDPARSRMQCNRSTHALAVWHCAACVMSSEYRRWYIADRPPGADSLSRFRPDPIPNVVVVIAACSRFFRATSSGATTRQQWPRICRSAICREEELSVDRPGGKHPWR